MTVLEQAIHETVGLVYEISWRLARFNELRLTNNDDEAFKVAAQTLECLRILKADKKLKYVYDAILYEFHNALKDVVAYCKEHKES